MQNLKETIYAYKDFGLEKSRDYFLRLLQSYVQGEINEEQLSQEAGCVMWGFDEMSTFEKDKNFADALSIADDLSNQLDYKKSGQDNGQVESNVETLKQYFEANKDKIKAKK